MCVCAGGRGCVEETVGNAVDKQVNTNKNNIHPSKNKEEMLSGLVARRSVRALVCSRPNLKSLSLRRRFPHITKKKIRCVSSRLAAATRMHALQEGDKRRKKRIKTQYPLSPPILFQPPPAEVGGSVVTKYDRDSDPQRT